MVRDDYEAAKRLNVAANNRLAEGDVDGALGLFSKAVELIPDDKLEARAKLLSNLGHVNVRLKRYDEALSSFRNAADIFRQLDDKVALGEQLGNIGSVYRDIQQWEHGLDSYFEALAVFNEVNHKGGIADQYGNIGYAYVRQGDFHKGFDFFEKAKILYDDLGQGAKVQHCDQNIQALKPYLEK